jgi:hypothetical protein
LLSEGREPVIAEFYFAALDELPCARVVGALLDREVDVADGDLVCDFVVENCLEGAYYLKVYHVSRAPCAFSPVACWSLVVMKAQWYTYDYTANVEENRLWRLG